MLLISFKQKTLNNSEIRAALERHWKASIALDIDKAHEIYHDVVVVEYPQSGERISGERNLYELRAHHPSRLSFKIRRVLGEGSIWVTEYIITYDGRPVNIVTIMEFRDGKVARETHYFADPFEPPEWRSQWDEKIQ